MQGELEPDKPEDFFASHVRRIVRRRPFLSTAGGLFLGVAMATLFGLPLRLGWSSLLVGLSMLAVVGLIVTYVKRRKAREETAGKAPSEYWSTVGIPLLAMILAQQFWFNSRQPQQVGSPWARSGQYGAKQEERSETPPLSPSRTPFFPASANTEAYWRIAVAVLHPFRFGQAPQSDELATSYYERQAKRFRAALARAKAKEVDGVDADLVAMAQRHFQLDDDDLRLYEILMSAESKLRPERGNLRLNQLRPVDETIFQWSDEEFAKLPAEVQEAAAAFVASQGARLDRLRDIELMQVRLEERYKGRKFMLPPPPEGK